MEKHLIILEGPAGAGKSTIIDGLIKAGIGVLAPEFASIERPRAYTTPDDGAGLSLIKDMARLSEAIACPAEVVIIDRAFASQLVYFAIRTGSVDLFERVMAAGYFRHVHQLVNMVSEEYWQRRYRYNAPQVTLTWIFVLPALTELARRRRKAGKEYPYEAEEELSLYLAVYHHMLTLTHREHAVRVKSVEETLQAMSEGFAPSKAPRWITT